MAAGVLVVFMLALAVRHSVQWSGHACPYTIVSYTSSYVCSCPCWWWGCCAHALVHQPIYTTAYKCCPGWRDDGDENCNIAICYPGCSNGGTCTSPGRCSCRNGYTGATCIGLDCNNERPCYPGECQRNGAAVVCNCMDDFDGTFCIRLKETQVPEVTQIRAQFSYMEDDGQMSKDIYSLIADGTEEKEKVIVWTNRQQLNKLNVTASAMFKGRDLPYPPAYIPEAKTGIARAFFKLSGPAINSQDKEHQCDDAVGSENPKETVTCTFTTSYTNPLTDGDKLTLTFRVSSGGFRKLVGTGTTATQHYTGEDAVSTVAFHVDTGEPVYNSPSDAFQIHPEFTNMPVTMKWEGWTDAKSGMDKYTWEAFKLEPTGNGSLTEVDKLRPFVHRQVDHTDPISNPLPYAPTRPGMYSFVLEAVDKANNSVYMRRFALYDKESEVTTDPNQALYISSAVQDQGFQWMTDASKPLVINWQNHFLNYVHESGKFLNNILPFKVKVVENPPIYKEVTYENDDHDGRRTTAAISNVRGIVRFEWTHAVNKTGGSTQATPPNWDEIPGLNTTMQKGLDNVTSGSTVTVWIRARDVVDNKKVDFTRVTYDLTEPQFSKMTFHQNELSTIPFSSGLEVTMKDQESGIDHLAVKVTEIGDGHLMTHKNLTIASILPHKCTDRVHDCYCPNALNVCYKRVYKLFISNCWLMVAKDALETAHVQMEVGVVNRAGLTTRRVHPIRNLMQLNGTEAFFGLENVKTERVRDTTVRVTWDHAPSCYERTAILVSYEWDSGASDPVQVFKDAKSYDIVGLEPGTKYRVSVTAEYGDIKSVPKSSYFTTSDLSGIGAGAVAGIVIALLLILVVLGAVFLLWKTGRLAVLIKQCENRQSRREGNVSGRITNNLGTSKNRGGVLSYQNNAYDDEDIYLYGGMTFATAQTWHISIEDLTLKDKLHTGRFAQMYKASHKSGKTASEVAAKVIRDTPDEENKLLMMAKINFAATQVGEHRNVLRFLGAVVNNDALGPMMVLEYCENGQLDTWLKDNRDKVDMDVLERIQMFVLGVARGMEFLANKEIVHRKLAARNCLVTFLYEVKISGFGPSCMDDTNDDDNTNNAKADRIPVKWTAPECLQSLKEANEKSDIWSFGITMWEILSMGQTPYPDIRSRDLPAKIRNGYRLPRPEYAEDIHYNMMGSCWEKNPQSRPTFVKIVQKLEVSFGLRPTSEAVYYYCK
ncbi:uncharacterized protein LOC124122676 isoform X1 [Haliotis rufescens]|uniref:uncharacterized protein LOC124122676 isoform X1 n=1 Tax=Haliotis rufescens TaxID=6454 RepID=UPI00201F2FC8|nr:uncharacterized protein LOC124122676 isoform X1 [Haliotis rufescens]